MSHAEHDTAAEEILQAWEVTGAGHVYLLHCRDDTLDQLDMPVCQVIAVTADGVAHQRVADSVLITDEECARAVLWWLDHFTESVCN